jgi:CheY-like chemotaxis protein
MTAEYNVPDYSGYTVLLVEDNRVNQLVAKAILTKAKFIVSVANNGQEAVDLVQKQRYNLVLMDIQMPIMDGFQAVKTIRKFGADFVTQPIIAMTAQDQAKDRQECIDAGMNEYVSKPISPEVLFQTISLFIKPNAERTNEVELDDELIMPTHLTQINLQAALNRFVNNWEVLKRTMLSFAKSHIDDVEKIKVALVHHDIDTATRLAHSLKGSGGNIGAETLYKIAAEIESLFKANKVNDATDKLENLDVQLNLVCNELLSLESVDGEKQLNDSTLMELTDESINTLQDDMRAVKDSLMLDYGKCQTLTEEISQKLQGSQWAVAWEKATNAVNQFDFNSVGTLIDQLMNDIGTQRSKPL